VKPPQTATRKKVKEYPPLEAYLRHLLLVRLEASEVVVTMVTKQLVRMPWFDPSYQCAAIVCKLMMKACRKGRYKTIEAVAAVAAKLRTQRAAGEVPIRLTDAVLEELRWALEQPNFRDQQRIITYTRLLGELHVVGQVSAIIILEQLFEFINYGHLIPESLRQASKEYISKAAIVESESSSSAKLPIYNSAGTVSQVIQEDEEMEDAELTTNVVEEVEAPKAVAVAPYSIYDPRVPSAKDPSTSTYRITLICSLLETSARALVTRSNIPRLKSFFAAFQRYLFTKTVLPTDVEFALLDTFDVVDSHWKRVSIGRGGNANSLDTGSGFPRYSTWLDAHMASVAAEESEAIFQSQKRARLEALADESKSLPEVSSSDGDHDESSLFHDDDESDSSGDDEEDESVSVKSKDSAGVDVTLDDDGNEMDIARDEDIGQSIDSDGGDNVDEDDGESDASDEDDDNEEEDEEEDYEEDEEEEFDEEAYMLQLEEEAFERELRLLTMEAIEKGKVTSRKQVDDSMISGSQIMKRKPSDSSKFTSSTQNPDLPPNTSIALSGGTGISFHVIKKGNKGKIELKELVVPVDTNLAVAATRHDDAAAKERDEIKQRVLRYEAQIESTTGGNVYLEQGRLERNRNRPLSMDDIDKNFGTSGGNLHPSQIEKKATNTATSSSGQRGNSTGSGRGAFNNYPGGRGLGRGGGRANIGGRHLF
jgi:regulator of nonsense transcripts 2